MDEKARLSLLQSALFELNSRRDYKTMKNFLHFLTYLLKIHLWALLAMTLFRVIFFFAVRNQIGSEALGEVSSYFQAFVRGVWFDNVVACYILLVPLIFTAVVSQFRPRLWMIRTIGLWFGVFYTVVFLAAAGNIPYYAYFSKMLNAGIWNWASYSGTTLGMIFGEVSYYPYILLFLIAVVGWCFLLRRFGKKLARDLRIGTRRFFYPKMLLRERITSGVAFALLIGLCLFGIRGRVGYNPIKVSAAYFCTNPVFNNLGLNPTFCLLNSTYDSLRPENRRLNLMADEEAVIQTQILLGREGIEGISPIARRVTPATDGGETAVPKHVVMVIMESMSAELMGVVPGGKGLTPYLDSLFHKSMSFSHCYSAGFHTNHGLYASLYGFPSIMFRNAMKGSDIPHYAGLPTVLKEQGYTTLFFMTHERQYDNMNAFFRTNGYDEIYSQENYPRKEVVNNFGVPDAYLFSYALPVLRKHAEEGPFFATLLTISNHPPYVLPEDFKAKSTEDEDRIVEYADRCIEHFMNEVEKEDWAKQTIFVFVGDHGKLVGKSECVLPKSYNHVPLIFYGADIEPNVRDDFACQVDIGPTLLSLLGISYTQNNFGVDLTREKRSVAFYTADKTIAARDSASLYVYDDEADEEYCYSLEGDEPRLTEFSPSFKRLKDYVFPLLQCTEWMVEQGMTLDKTVEMQ